MSRAFSSARGTPGLLQGRVPPARADNCCAYNCYAANLSALCHTFLLIALNISKFLELTWSKPQLREEFQQSESPYRVRDRLRSDAIHVDL